MSYISNIILDKENYFNKKIYLTYLKIYNRFYKKIKFGEFEIKNKLNLFDITKLISQPSNYYRNFVIIGGWQSYQLDQLIQEKFNIPYKLSYSKIIADTYKYQSHNNFEDIYKLMKKYKNDFFLKHDDNTLLNKYTVDQIMIIASLVEKEGKIDVDKKLISSVILNRLDKNLKLEIDATTIFSITKGRHKFKRKLSYKDLKIQDQYNTYYITGLPPMPICYVSRKTIELVLENYKSEYLFYFFDHTNDKHIFSRNFKEHKKVIDEYRKNK